MMRGTMILYAYPEVFELLAEDCRRFGATRTGFFQRLFAAWLVFCGRADALSWDEAANKGERP